MSAVIGQHEAHGHDAHEHGHHPTGWRRWLFATNHKDIGTMYLWFSFAMFMIGGINALALRTELFQPGLQFLRPEFFNQLTTMHGLLMIFGAIMPAFVGFANWQIPMMIGAGDMAFARMNNFSFWLLPAAGFLFPRPFLGLAVMQRRYEDYPMQFADYNMMASIGAFGFGLSQLIFLAAIIKCIKGGPKAGDNPWQAAHGLEWTLPSPAPFHTFETPPVIK